MTWAYSMTAAIPVFSRAVNANVQFGSGWFLAGMTCFGLCVALGMVGRLCGRLTVADPAVHFSKSLRWDEWKFKKTALLGRRAHG